MYRIFQTVLFALILLTAIPTSGLRAEEGLRELVNAFGEAKLSDMDEHIAALAKTGDPKVVPILEALGEGNLYARKADGQVFLTKEGGATLTLTDPVTAKAPARRRRRRFPRSRSTMACGVRSAPRLAA